MDPIMLLLLGGAAVAVAGKKKTPPTKTVGPPPESPPPLTKTVKKTGSGYPGVTREKMQWIQTTLVALGYDVGPKGMDGRLVCERREWGGVQGKVARTARAARRCEAQTRLKIGRYSTHNGFGI